MITEIHSGLSIADDAECLPGLQLAGTKAVIHAAKYPHISGINAEQSAVIVKALHDAQ